ncbi:hypothetical protein F4823DRAFT_597854 [Ustulina deusta]|nr:hypothetical protein F4823DRAFT_597854 [Ustulina deusta]
MAFSAFPTQCFCLVTKWLAHSDAFSQQWFTAVRLMTAVNPTPQQSTSPVFYLISHSSVTNISHVYGTSQTNRRKRQVTTLPIQLGMYSVIHMYRVCSAVWLHTYRQCNILHVYKGGALCPFLSRVFLVVISCLHAYTSLPESYFRSCPGPLSNRAVLSIILSTSSFIIMDCYQRETSYSRTNYAQSFLLSMFCVLLYIMSYVPSFSRPLSPSCRSVCSVHSCRRFLVLAV